MKAPIRAVLAATPHARPPTVVGENTTVLEVLIYRASDSTRTAGNQGEEEQGERAHACHSTAPRIPNASQLQVVTSL